MVEQQLDLINPETIKLDIRTGMISAIGANELKGVVFEYVFGVKGSLDNVQKYIREQSVSSGRRVIAGVGINEPKTITQLAPVTDEDCYGIWVQSQWKLKQTKRP